VCLCARVYPKVSGLSHNEISNNKHSLEARQRVISAKKITRVTHKIAIQLHLVAESCTICSSRSRRPVRNFLVTPSYRPGLSAQVLYSRLCLMLIHCLKIWTLSRHTSDCAWILRSCTRTDGGTLKCNKGVSHLSNALCERNILCSQNDTMRLLYAYYSDDPTPRPGSKLGSLSYHGPTQRGFRSLYLMERVNLDTPVPQDLLSWDLRNPAVSHLICYYVYVIHKTFNEFCLLPC